MQLTHNLRVIIVDVSVFYYQHDDDDEEEEELLDLNNQQDKFPFHKCCNVLEHLSIPQAKYKNDD